MEGYSITGNFTDEFGMIYIKKGATVTFVDGLIENTADVAVAVYGYVIVATDATVNGYGAGIYNMYYTGDYYGGARVSGEVNAIWNSGELVVSEYGVVEYLDNSGYATIYGTVNEIYAQDGTDAPDVFNGNMLIISDVAKVGAVEIPEDYKLVEVEPYVYKVVACNYVAEVNGAKFETLAEALAADGEVKLLADVAIDTLVVAVGETVDLNGYTLTADIIGATIKMNGGNFATSDYLMVGATEGKYTSTDAVFTIAANATMDMTFISGTVTLNEELWYTLEGQTLTVNAGATFVIPEGKTLYINGSNVVVNGTAANFGTLVLANGAHLKGDVAGTFKMAGGTFETSQYVMIGATEGKYISTDAVFTIAPNATFDMTFVSGTVTLNETLWYTLEGQTLTVNAGATFVIPEGKTLYINGSNVVVNGTAANFGTLVLANGAHLKGDIAGTFKMAGGTFETSQYVMIGATEGKYLSTDAVFTIAPNATLDMTVVSGTITLNDADWWTLAGQTLVIAKDAKFVVPAGKNINVQGTVIVEGTAVTEGTVTLYNENATVKAAAGLNVVNKVGICVVYVDGVYSIHTAHDYTDVTYTDPTNDTDGFWTYTCICGDSYTVVDEGTVLHAAVNVATGETYADLQAALTAAAKGETVKLLKDTEAEDIYVGSGKTLDLNGKKLTVTASLSASFATTHIIDSSNGEGLLVVDGADVALNSKNAQLPVWTAEGVKFAEVAYKQKTETVNNNADAVKYRFYFDVDANAALHELLTEDCLTVRIKVNYTTASGMKAYQHFELTDALIAEYLEQAGSIDLTLRGAAGLQDLIFTAEIVSVAPNGSSVIIGSTPLSV